MRHRKSLVILSLLLAALLILANGIGLWKPEVMYAKESSNWYAQSVGQDIANLVLAFPSLLITSIFIYRRSKRAMLIWGGVLLYLIYTFAIYCFAIHFNSLFIVYCVTLGLAFYLFAWFFLSQYKEPITEWFNNKIPGKTAAIYLIIVAVVFYVHWLMQIIPPALAGTVPPETVDAGLVTNPVHVLDLSICLPGITITGVLLLRRHPVGLLLAPVFLTFFILMDLTIGGLMIILKWRGFIVNGIVMGSMFALAVASSILLAIYLRTLRNEA